MKLIVTEEAAEWFIDELGLEAGDYIQFTVKLYGGIQTMYPNYYLGISKGHNGVIHIKDEVKGITFYFNKDDAWLLEQHDMVVSTENRELDVSFHKENEEKDLTEI